MERFRDNTLKYIDPGVFNIDYRDIKMCFTLNKINLNKLKIASVVQSVLCLGCLLYNLAIIFNPLKTKRVCFI
jgi:hypothetical protein